MYLNICEGDADIGWEPKEEELKEMVSVIDQDGDGDISFNEFVWLMTKWVAKRIMGTKELIKSFSLQGIQRLGYGGGGRIHFVKLVILYLTTQRDANGDG